jgi:hypothetical protein
MLKCLIKKIYITDQNKSYQMCPAVCSTQANPFCRFCGDYREINKYINAQHSPIPNVGTEIPLIFADLDMKTSFFYQLPLAESSRQYLTIQTP